MKTIPELLNYLHWVQFVTVICVTWDVTTFTVLQARIRFRSLLPHHIVGIFPCISLFTISSATNPSCTAFGTPWHTPHPWAGTQGGSEPPS